MISISAEEHAELLRDRARLDWLADPKQHLGNVQLPRVCVAENLDSLRGAIDAAMKMHAEGSAT